MARLKRLAAPVFMPVEKKASKFVVAPRNGYDKIPLALIVRDVLGYAKNYKEAAKIIKSGQVNVDGVPRKDPNFGVGLMDVVSMNYNNYRVVPSNNGIVLTEIDEKEANKKLVRVDGKKTIAGGKIQLNLNDGTNMIHKDSVSTKDVLVLGLPERKVEKVLNFKEGNLVVVIRGKNAGTVGTVKEIHTINGLQPNKVFIEASGKTIEFPEDYVFVVGEETPIITVTKSE